MKLIDPGTRPPKNLPSHRDLDSVVKDEVTHWTRVSGKEHVVKLEQTFFQHGVYYLVMERCFGSVADHFQELMHASMTSVASVIKGMLAGVQSVHEAGLVHRDIKLANFLLGGPKGSVVKICDFGLALRMTPSGKPLEEGFIAGTLPYMAPEMLQSEGIAKSVDLWSLGVCAYLLCYGDFPYGGRISGGSDDSNNALQRAIVTGIPEPPYLRKGEHLDVSLPSNAEDFVRCLLQRDKNHRGTAKQAMQHPFVESVDLDLGTSPLLPASEGEEIGSTTL